MKNFLLLGIAVVVLAVILLPRISKNVSNESLATASPTITPTAEGNFEELNWELYEFPEVGLSFSAPFEMDMTGEMLDDQTFTLYIQRSTYPEAQYYQLYGIYNLNGSKDVNKEDVKTELDPDSIEETTISGFDAIQGQYKGERNRLVTFLFTDRGIFTLATSEPNDENKELTDQILRTFVLN